MAGGRRPPLQLLPSDRYNYTLAMLVAFVLASCKDLKILPRGIRWQLNCYTNWNLVLLAVRFALGQAQWDPFLCVNSVGIMTGIRTGMSQGLIENLRKKVNALGFPLGPWQWFFADHLCHTAPSLLIGTMLVRRRQRVPFVNVAYALTLGTWFAFRQQAKLDSSDIYIPHPWRRAWAGIFSGTFLTPLLVDAIIAQDCRRVTFLTLALLLPWLSTRLDPGLRRKYHFEYAVAAASSLHPEAEKAGASTTMPRSQSQPAQSVSRLPRR